MSFSKNTLRGIVRVETRIRWSKTQITQDNDIVGQKDETVLGILGMGDTHKTMKANSLWGGPDICQLDWGVGFTGKKGQKHETTWFA